MAILVVESNKIIGDWLENSLSSAGHKVVLAKTGQQAIEALDDASFELLVCSQNLHGFNGFELLQEIHSYQDLKDIKTIILSDNMQAISDFQPALKNWQVVKVLDLYKLNEASLQLAVNLGLAK